jgi:hypothetical protein
MPLADVRRVCPHLLYSWLWLEGMPEPVVVACFGTVTATIELEDTLPTSGVYRITTSSATARTPDSVGPGTTVRELLRRLGPLEMLTGEGHSLFAVPKRRPGLSFELDVPGHDEELITRVEQTQAVSLLPPKTVVANVLVNGH